MPEVHTGVLLPESALCGPSPGRLDIVGIKVDRVDLQGACARIGTFVQERANRQVVTVNPEFVMTARRNRAFRRVLLGADLAIADGMGIVWAARILGSYLPERVGGVELLELVVAQAAREQHRLFLLGAGEGVAAEAARRLAARYPNLIIAGTYAGSPKPEEAGTITALIRAARPDILFVAFGAPAQDLWIDRYRAELNVPVAIGIGGAFDYLSGRQPRAPRALQHAGLEWLYRLVRQPWRWRRMLALPRFALLVLATRLFQGPHANPP